MIDYIAMMQEYYAGRNDGFLTDAPKTIQFSEDDYIRVTYDAKAMQTTTHDFVLAQKATDAFPILGTSAAYRAGYRLDLHGYSTQRQGS